MKSDLELLIEHLVNERKYLQSEIDKCVGMRDYTSAQFFNDALFRINDKLRILDKWEPKSTLIIEELNSLIEYWKKKIKREELNENDNRRRLNIKRYQEKIRSIEIRIKNNQKPSSKKYIDSPIIDDAIFELLAQEFIVLRFHLQSWSNSYLDISLTSLNQFQFSFIPKEESKKVFWTEYYYFHALNKIGFKKKKESFNYELDLNKNSFFEIKELLARIFLEIIVRPRDRKEQFFIEKI